MKLNKTPWLAIAGSLLISAAPVLAEEPEQQEVVPVEVESEGGLEGFNRGVHRFNGAFDSWILKPITKGYKAVTPDPVENGVTNFFSNLGEIINIPNDLLQGKFKQAGNDTGRLLINSTLGIGGLFDVADDMGLEESDGEDLGQTLAVWGVPSGPYIVVPFLGPSTIRDLPADITERIAFSPIQYIDNVSLRNSLYGLALVDTRAQLLDAEQLITGDEYTFIKNAYLQRRDFLINDGEVEDDFGDDFGEYGSDEEY